MATVKDIMIDDDADLVIKNGDFYVADSDQQHVTLIINTSPGHWKKFPTCGVGIINYLASSGKGAELKRSINVQLDADGYKVNRVELSESTDGLFEYSIDAQRL